MNQGELLVEGDLDAELLLPVFRGRPEISPERGSKYALAPRTRDLRKRARSKAFWYLRDRDFDFEPPKDCSRPQEDRQDDGAVLGWRWCRHEIENYMLEPAIVSKVLECDLNEYEHALLAAGVRICHYESARWAIGTARHALPPFYELRTRPSTDAEFFLPADLSAEATQRWALEQVCDFRTRVMPSLDPDSVAKNIGEKAAFFDKSVLPFAAQVLVWFSGKDLIASMEGWGQSKGLKSAGQFRKSVRDWMIANSDMAIDCLPEWKQLKEEIQRAMGLR